MTTVEEFRSDAERWVRAQLDSAPPDWGPIMPPERRAEGMDWQRRIHEAGFAGIHWPVEHGGRGLTDAHHRAFAETCQAHGVPSVLNMVGLVLAAGAIRTFGTADQQREHLGPTLRGERVWCQLFSEPDAGSDLAGLTTSAVLDGERWIVNGQKVWTSGARASDWGILMARTEPDAPKHQGISFFLIDMTTAGVETRPLRQMTGDAEFDEVFLTDVELPATALVGERGQGWHLAMATLLSERSHIGGATRALERRLDRLISSTAAQVGPVGRDRLAALLVEGRAYLAMLGRRGPGAAHPSLGKLATTRFTFDLAEFAADASGADSMLEGPASAGLVAAPGAWFGGGTSQVQQNIIGERVLGLPREPRPG